jgi:hypothetical protein
MMAPDDSIWRGWDPYEIDKYYRYRDVFIYDEDDIRAMSKGTYDFMERYKRKIIVMPVSPVLIYPEIKDLESSSSFFPEENDSHSVNLNKLLKKIKKEIDLADN